MPDKYGWLTYVYPGEPLQAASARWRCAAGSVKSLFGACRYVVNMHINDLLQIAVANGASDLHLKVGSYPMMRLTGTLVVVTEVKRLDRADTEAMAQAVFTPDHLEKFRRSQEVDLAYSIPGLGRFRVNVFQQRGTIGLV